MAGQNGNQRDTRSALTKRRAYGEPAGKAAGASS